MPKFKPVLNFDADDVWGASYAAQRINGSYVKTVTEGTNTGTNRQIIDRLLENVCLITEDDREEGRVIRKYFQGFTFKILQGKLLSEFDNSAMVIANRNVIQSNYDIAVIASLPSTYTRAIKRDNDNRRIQDCSGGFVGKLGEKVKLTMEVVRSVYSQQYNIFFVTGITTDDQAVFFSFKNSIEVGTIITVNGTVKAHRENTSQLSYTKVFQP